MKKIVKVVGAIIENEQNQVLCALRSTKMTLPNLWEFPGGKIEKGESIADAIVREIKEELNCDIEFINIFNDNTHEYDNSIVNLITTKCKIVGEHPTANEHAKLIWLNKENLLSLNWAPADLPAVKLLASKID